MTLWTGGKTVRLFPKFDADMGNFCSATGLVKCILRHRLRCEISNMLYKIVDDERSGPNNAVNVPYINKRLICLKKHMDIIRGLSNNWTEMIQLYAGQNDSHCVMLKTILNSLFECDNVCKVADIICLCTYVTDVCVVLLSRNDQSDSYVFENVDTLVNYLINKNTDTCVKFLQYLDLA